MPYGHDDGNEKRKRFAVIGISTFLLVAMVIAVTLGVSLHSSGNRAPASDPKSTHDVAASVKAIKSMCSATDYKKECVESLTSETGNATTDPKKLVQAGFKVAMRYITEAAKKSVVLQELEKDPRASKALGYCKQLMESSVDELRHSFQKVSQFDLTKVDEMMMDLKVWISATITYQETCLDSFKNTTGDAAEKMKSALKTSMRLSSNGLAMISEISSVFSDLSLSGLQGGGSRRLFAEEEEEKEEGERPLAVLGHGDEAEWFNAGTRRLMAAEPSKVKPDVVVAKDGSGKFKSINEALKDVPRKSEKTFVVYIKEGVYQEYVVIEKNMTNLMFVGDGANKTRITGSRNFVDGIPTSLTATVVVLGDYFKARDVGFENTAGPEKHQAVALRVNADYAVFFQCAMDAYQDTLYTHAKRQFYRDCAISGTIDFVFGDAAAVFQNCRFVVRKPMEEQQCIVTAQGRKDRRQPSAIIIQNGTIVADPEYYPDRNRIPAYLGRPWKEYSRTVIMDSFIDDLIQPKGWKPWAGDFGLRTCFYAEVDNRGPGSIEAGSGGQRVKWRGIKNVTTEAAGDFQAAMFFRGDWWIKSSGVPYYRGSTAEARAKNE